MLLLLPISYNFQIVERVPAKKQKLGDGYDLTSDTPVEPVGAIAIEAKITTQSKLEEVVTLFEGLKGVDFFQWRPNVEYAIADWIVESWSVRWEGTSLWTLTATFSNR